MSAHTGTPSGRTSKELEAGRTEDDSGSYDTHIDVLRKC